MFPIPDPNRLIPPNLMHGSTGGGSGKTGGRRKSSRFRCPSCNVSLTKSPQAQMLGDLYDSNASFFAFGDPPQNVICPNCMCPIDSMKMMRGDYDETGELTRGQAYGFAIGGVAFLILVFFVPWWVALILGFVVAGLGISFFDPASAKKM